MEHRFNDIQGWFNFKDLYDLGLSITPENGIIIEIGAWKGKSASYMGVEIVNKNRKINFHVIDTFKGSAEHTPDETKNLYYEYQKNTLGLPIFTHKTDSLDISLLARFNSACHFAFIDASHKYTDVVNDITAWWNCIVKGGILAGHDYDWADVKKAVDEFFSGKGTVCVSGTSWFVLKN